MLVCLNDYPAIRIVSKPEFDGQEADPGFCFLFFFVLFAKKTHILDLFCFGLQLLQAPN